MTPSSHSPVRPYYVFTAVVLGIGAVLSVIASSWGSFLVFSVLCGMAIWITARVSRLPDPADERPAAGDPTDPREAPRRRRGRRR